MLPKELQPLTTEKLVATLVDKIINNEMQPKDALIEYINNAMNDMQTLQPEQKMLVLTEMLKQIKEFCTALNMKKEDSIFITQSLLKKIDPLETLKAISHTIKNTSDYNEQMQAIEKTERSIDACQSFDDILPKNTHAQLLEAFFSALGKKLRAAYITFNHNNTRDNSSPSPNGPKRCI